MSIKKKGLIAVLLTVTIIISLAAITFAVLGNRPARVRVNLRTIM